MSTVLREGLTQVAIMLAPTVALAGAVWPRIYAPAVVFTIDRLGDLAWWALIVHAVGASTSDSLRQAQPAGAAPPPAPVRPSW